MKKVLSSDEIYDLIKKSHEIIWDGYKYDIEYYNEEYVELISKEDEDKIAISYYEMEIDLKSNDDSYIEFYGLKKIEIGE